MKIHGVLYLCVYFILFPDISLGKKDHKGDSTYLFSSFQRVSRRNTHPWRFQFELFVSSVLQKLFRSCSERAISSVCFTESSEAKFAKESSVKSEVFQLKCIIDLLSELKMVRRLIHITYHILVNLFFYLIAFLPNRIPKGLEMLMTFIKKPPI